MKHKFSKILNMNILINDDNSIVCEDETFYKPEELKLLNDCSNEEKVAIHKIKKIFLGEVVKKDDSLFR